jgi:hypothetical protein
MDLRWPARMLELHDGEAVKTLFALRHGNKSRTDQGKDEHCKYERVFIPRFTKATSLNIHEMIEALNVENLDGETSQPSLYMATSERENTCEIYVPENARCQWA